VTPQAARFLAKARQLLDDAETMLRVGLNQAAGFTPISPAIMRRRRLFSSGTARFSKRTPVCRQNFSG
jgi:DNA-binding transcriptional LysR family regulator